QVETQVTSLTPNLFGADTRNWRLTLPSRRARLSSGTDARARGTLSLPDGLSSVENRPSTRRGRGDAKLDGATWFEGRPCHLLRFCGPESVVRHPARLDAASNRRCIL